MRVRNGRWKELEMFPSKNKTGPTIRRTDFEKTTDKLTNHTPMRESNTFQRILVSVWLKSKLLCWLQVLSSLKWSQRVNYHRKISLCALWLWGIFITLTKTLRVSHGNIARKATLKETGLFTLELNYYYYSQVDFWVLRNVRVKIKDGCIAEAVPL